MKAKKIILASIGLMTFFASCQQEDELKVQSPSAAISPAVGSVTPVISTTVNLTSILLFMSKSSGLTGTVTVRIVEVSGTVKGQATLNVSKINNYAPRWANFELGSISLRKGTLHRIEVVCSNQSRTEYLQWYADANTYAGGTMGLNGSNMIGDFSFATYYKKGTSTYIGQQSSANDRASYVVNRVGLTYWQEFKTEPLFVTPK